MTREENPAAELTRRLIRREAPAWAHPRVAWLLALGVLFGCFPLVATVGTPSPSELVWNWLVVATGLVTASGLFFLAVAGRTERESALLVTFQKGGCLDEILGTRIGVAELVDGLALATVRRALAFLAPTAACTLGLLAALATQVRDPAGPLLAWFFLVLLLAGGALGLSYLGVAAAALTSGREESPTRSLRTGLLAGTLGPGFVMFVVASAFGPVWMALSLGAAALWTAGCSRGSALWALGRGGGLQGAFRWLDLSHWLRPRHPNPWLAPWSDNPIAAREAARESHRVPLGLLGALLARGGLGALAGVVLLLLAGWSGGLQAPEFRVFVEVLFALGALGVFSAAASRAVDLVVSEHEARTLPLLLATPLTVDELATGCVSVASRAAGLQFAGFALAMLLGTCLSGGSAPLALLPGAAIPLLWARFGAWLGLQAAAPVPTRQEALARSGNLGALWLAGCAVSILVSGGFLVGGVPFRFVYLLWTGLVGLGGLRVSRAFALEALRHRPEDGTVGAAPGAG